ncbi:uncharacterized protein DS421_10g293960 [Arachis hypogaea]|nr:uncharacterized protein DS421_10g293960 [Arachis hypogaea]
MLFLFLIVDFTWKYFVFLSMSFMNLSLDCCFQYSALLLYHSFTWFFKVSLLIKFSSCLSLASISFFAFSISSSKHLIFVLMLANIFLYRSLIGFFIFFSFSATVPPSMFFYSRLNIFLIFR